MLIAVVPLIVAIIGLLIYALAANPKLVHVGDVMFWTGVLVTLLSVANKTVKLF